VFRAASDEELGMLSRLSRSAGLDELAWVLVYRHGPITDEKLGEQLSHAPSDLVDVIARLESTGRVQRSADGRLTARDFVIPLGASVGWEAAVFDHVQAVVQTICQRLQLSASSADLGDSVGGSTYTFDIWPGHPLEREVTGLLSELRQRLGEVRRRVEAHNQSEAVQSEYRQVVTYVGQCSIDRERDLEEGEASDGEQA
jgi:hypothetical protein